MGFQHPYDFEFQFDSCSQSQKSNCATRKYSDPENYVK